jgi:formate dehydrogenase subunit gamma
MLLGVFYIARGRIRIDGGPAGSTITRFKAVERFGHWVLAGSFILLGVTGLLTLFGRVILAPYFGKELNSTLLIASKWIHNNVSWAFMLALIMVFVMWVVHNIPNRTDWIWIKQGGGIFTKSHPPAKKFNFGQKIIFWGVIVLGASVSASGLSLTFPFEMPMFAKTFAILNNIGLSEALGFWHAGNRNVPTRGNAICPSVACDCRLCHDGDDHGAYLYRDPWYGGGL